VPLERRQDPRGELRRATPIDQIEQRVQVVPTVACEPLGVGVAEPGAAQPGDAPGEEILTTGLQLRLSPNA
jgi:hypothetical protein